LASGQLNQNEFEEEMGFLYMLASLGFGGNSKLL
jgi:hypothetical protein